MIAINPKVSSLRSQCLRRDFCSARVCVIRDFTKGHFIDNSNDYKFIYVLASSSSEKNTFSTIAGFLIFFRRKFEPE